MRVRPLLLLLAAPTTAVLYARCFRPWQLSWGATPEELSRHLPGDELVTRPTFEATRAIAFSALVAFGDIWMMRRMLLNLRARAEVAAYPVLV